MAADRVPYHERTAPDAPARLSDPRIPQSHWAGRRYVRGPCGSCGGLSVIELVVAVSIMGLLMTILAPVLCRIRLQARRSMCMSNLRALGIAYATYALDYDGYFPAASANGNFGKGGLPSIAMLLAKYINRQMFWCPEDKWWRDPNNAGLSYRYAYELGGAGGLTSPQRMEGPFDYIVQIPSQPHVTTKSPSRVLVMHDGMAYWESDAELGVTVPGQAREARQHLGGDNVLLADGHVEYFKGGFDFEKVD